LRRLPEPPTPQAATAPERRGKSNKNLTPLSGREERELAILSGRKRGGEELTPEESKRFTELVNKMGPVEIKAGEEETKRKTWVRRL